jgi:uncharacterized Zn finger protein
MQCPICDCEEVQFVAVLGDVGHARCRDCGIVYTFTPSLEDECYVGSEDSETDFGGI